MPRLKLGSVLLLSLVMGGCAGDKSTLVPVTTRILDALPRVENSRASPCWLQIQIAAQNSYLASVTAGQEVTYHAPCMVDKPQTPPPAKAQPKTS